MSSLLKTLNKNQNEKFNPDVANLYNKTNQTRNTIKYNFTNEGYKTIINDNLPKIIKSKEDLKINYEKISSKDLPVINKKITELEYEREMEKEKLVKQIDHNKKLDEVIKIKRKEKNEENYQASTHSELKNLTINSNDKIKKEKQRYNNIVDSINDILKN
jgi:hypothetical protein|uniref:Uncharacterized protein n=1 Tax=viral metagenome TaxID=1070528 RepID=A0A6C0H0L3_9ZZZZ